MLKLQGNAEDAVDVYRQALALDPAYSDGFSNLLFAMQYAANLSTQAVFAEHLIYAQRYEAPHRPMWQKHANAREPNRRLKVGYVSADFRHHAVAYFIEPVLASHDKGAFEVVCYYNGTLVDAFTERIKAVADQWVPCQAMTDEQLAARTVADQIDILVDLSGHTAGNRLPVFARKPAPVQVTWLGYFGSTGLTAMDYRLTDAYMDPPGFADSIHTEKLVRLPFFSPFQPADCSPAVNELPALQSGRLTLASMNSLAKLNPVVVALWARILKVLTGSRMMLCNLGDGDTRALVLEMFAREGIEADRLVIQPWLPMAQYLALHNQIDLALDPFPLQRWHHHQPLIVDGRAGGDIGGRPTSGPHRRGVDDAGGLARVHHANRGRIPGLCASTSTRFATIEPDTADVARAYQR
ncbi:MAG: hypothetical protein IPG23_05770 [Burkholderiales bacterium]|nr:hypothetical protein [Burkholderiales bacterium]